MAPNIMKGVFSTSVGESGGAPRAFDADVLSWETSVIANGGSVSLARRIIVDQFIYSEKASGAWALTDDYIGLWAENSTQALISLKRRILAVAYNTPTFTVDRGYATDGVTSYIDTLYTPVTDALAMTSSSNHFEIYERSEVNVNAYSGGAENTSNRRISIRSRVGTVAYVTGNSQVGTFTLPIASSLGLTQGGRNGGLVTDVYGAKNGVDMVRTADPPAVGASLPINSIFIGGYNNLGTLISPKASSFGFVSYGAALTGTQRLARYNNVQAWATAVGAQV